MYDIDRSKYVFVSLLEEFIRETEHSLAYFFAVLIFLLTFLLALFGREALYTGLIGVLCLLLIKLRDIIEGFKETRQNFIFYPSDEKRKIRFSDDAALSMMAQEFPQKFDQNRLKKEDFLSYLQKFWSIVETIGFFLPDRPLSPETKQAVEKTTVTAQKYLLSYLGKKYGLTGDRRKELETLFASEDTDSFLLLIRLEKYGIDEKTGKWVVNVIDTLKKIRKQAAVISSENAQKTPV